MLDQKKTGKFITEMRKEKGLTQKQLADEIGVSDKTVSRWETGRGMPDTSIMFSGEDSTSYGTDLSKNQRSQNQNY